MSKVERLYNIKIVRSGKERLEVYKYQLPIREGTESKNSNGRRGKDNLSKEEKEKNSEQRRKETLVAARNNIIRLIKCNHDMNTFITLTYSADRDIKDSRKDLNKLFKKLKYKQNDLKYLWVMEYTKKGRIHFHVLTNFNIDITFIGKGKKSDEHKKIESEFSNKFWQHGFIDIRRLDQEGNTNIALYVATYLTKDMMILNLDNNRIYGYSAKTLNKPIIEKLETKDKIQDLIELNNYDLKYVNQYQINYRNKKNEEVESLVTYFDYQINND